MAIHAVLAILNSIADQLEDVTIERDAVADILIKAGYSRQDVEHIWSDAKLDPANRSKARLAVADLRRKLEEHGIAAGLVKHPEKLPTPDKAN
jgi:hypothetical protein